MITVKNLSFAYPTQNKNAINDINFEIPRGTIFGFLGPSGAGKSTTQKILFKLLSGYQGMAQIEGKEVRHWGKELYHKIGVGFELPNHYLKLTALENLRFFAAFYQQQLCSPEQLLEMVGLEKDAHKPVSDFSKGMKMRLNFVRALLHNPDVLFLDEPTSGLDPVNARIIKDIILQLKQKGKTIFITTHQMYDADELCDTVAFMVGGQILAMDNPQSLKLQHSRQKVEVRVKEFAETHFFDMQNLADNSDFLSFIRQNTLQTIHSKEATLEDVFIKITGHQLGAVS